MPAYNEADHIVAGIEETAETFNDFGCLWELIVVDDGSGDETFERASKLSAKYPGNLIVKKILFIWAKEGHLKKHCII